MAEGGNTVFDLRRLLRSLSFSNIGIVYVWVVAIIVFSITTPDLFPTTQTVRAVLNNYSLAALAALAVLVPMISGAIDASVGGNISLASVVCARLLVSTHLSIPIVVALTLAVGAVIGLANVIVVVVLQIPPIIGTLAIWLIADALSSAVSGNVIISSTRVSGSFATDLSQASWHNITIPVLFVLVLTILLGVLLTQTAAGRYTYAVGLNRDVARNAGIRVKLVQVRALVAGGMLGAFTGIVFTSQVAAATPRSGDSYLLPAFAAVFLGATQFRSKRFNAWGTILAVFMLGTGQYGLILAGAPGWTPNVFQGIALIAAIGVSQFRRSHLRRPRSFRFKRKIASNGLPPSPGAPGAMSSS